MNLVEPSRTRSRLNMSNILLTHAQLLLCLKKELQSWELSCLLAMRFLPAALYTSNDRRRLSRIQA